MRREMCKQSCIYGDGMCRNMDGQMVIVIVLLLG